MCPCRTQTTKRTPMEVGEQNDEFLRLTISHVDVFSDFVMSKKSLGTHFYVTIATRLKLHFKDQFFLPPSGFVIWLWYLGRAQRCPKWRYFKLWLHWQPPYASLGTPRNGTHPYRGGGGRWRVREVGNCTPGLSLADSVGRKTRLGLSFMWKYRPD